MKEKQIIEVSRYSDGNFHCVAIKIPNEGVRVSNSGDTITIQARWDKARFKMPEVHKL